MCGSPPIAFGHALHAVRHASDRWAAVLAIALSGVEFVLWLVLVGSLAVQLFA